MERRDIYFQQVIAINILKKTFQDISENNESFEEFCSIYEINNGLKEDFQSVLPSIISILERSADDILKSKAPLADYSGFLFNVLTKGTNIEISKDDYRNFLDGLMNEEVGLAIGNLKESRKKATLSHRGRGFGKDDASREGLRSAIKENISEIEFDVRISKDGKIIIHHNVTLGASANRLEAIKDLTWEELQQIELINGEHLTTLDDFFETIKELDNQVTKINIDIKDYNREMLDNILKLIKENHFEHRVNIVSWLPQSLQYLYEKEPSLHYSMSYFPGLRAIPKLIISMIERNPELLNTIGSFFSKQRQDALAKGKAKPQSEIGEFASYSTLLDHNKLYQEFEEEFKKMGRETFGIHETAIGDLPVDDEYIKIMARVLHGGSLNIKVWRTEVSQLFDATLGKMPVLKEFKSAILDLVSGENILRELISKCSENNIKINIYDVGQEEDRIPYQRAYNYNFDEKYKKPKDYIKLKKLKERQKFRKLKKLKEDPGVVYSSNPDMVPRLDTRVSKRSKK